MLIKELEKSGFNEKQAEALSLAFKKTQQSQLEELATKSDINELELELKSELKLIKWGLALVIAVTVLPVLKELFS